MTQLDPQPGDLLQHPVFGVFRVQQVQDQHVLAARADQRFLVPKAALRQARPAKGGVMLGVAEPEELRKLVVEDPLAALAELMEEVECSRDMAASWLTGLGVLGAEEFDRWWEQVSAEVEEDDRFVLEGEVIRWREAPTMELAEPISVELQPLAPEGSLAAEELFSFALLAAESMALVHNQGAAVLQRRDRVQRWGLRLQFESSKVNPEDFCGDIRFLLRLCLEQVLGKIPPQVADLELPFLTAAVNRGVPPEFLGVCIEGFSERGINDGLELQQLLLAAEATSRLRRGVPWNFRAQVVLGFDTHIGLMKSLSTQTNQDSFLLVGEPDLAMLVVADGISLCTVGSGDKASSIVVRSLRQSWMMGGEMLRGASSPRVHAFLESALRRANEAVCEASSKLVDGKLEGEAPMGTTVVAAVMSGNRVHLAALGDSRAYIATSDMVYPLTWDQNLKAMQLRMALSGLDVDWGEPGHALVGFAGHFDSNGKAALPPLMQRTLVLLPGEWLVLCSDGFSDYAGADEGLVGEVLKEGIRKLPREITGPVAMDLVRGYVAAANRGGGGDNITVLAFTLSPDEPAPSGDNPLPSPSGDHDLQDH
jgi:PPM family protein phosphatase